MQNDSRRPEPDPGIARAAIDAGLTGDKVPAGDPAAAPLQTDAESAGTPTSAAQAEADVRRQHRIARETGADGRPIMAGADPAARAQSGPRIAVIGVVVVAAALLIAILAGLA